MIKLLTPVGRLVGGHPSKKQQKTNFVTKEPILRNGEPVYEYRCDIAIPKAEFLAKVWPVLVREASTVNPSLSNFNPENCIGRTGEFAWKIVNGDSDACPKGSQIPYRAREGYPGHFIMKLSTQNWAPCIYHFENGKYRQLEENEVKVGDYLVADITVSSQSTDVGGLYLNPNGFNLVGYGAAIINKNADPALMFGMQQYSLPPGASATPVSGAPTSMGFNNAPAQQYAPQPAQQYAPQPAQQYAPQPAPQPVQQYAPQPVQQAPAPAYDIVQGVGVATAMQNTFPQPVQQQVVPDEIPF